MTLDERVVRLKEDIRRLWGYGLEWKLVVQVLDFGMIGEVRQRLNESEMMKVAHFEVVPSHPGYFLVQQVNELFDIPGREVSQNVGKPIPPVRNKELSIVEATEKQEATAAVAGKQK